MFKIVVCEDEKDQQELIGLLIEKYAKINCWDFTISFFENAADFWTDHDPQMDLVFLDVYLNQDNGVEIARTLRQQQQNCAIVFVTSSTSHALEGFELNAQHYITKPISQEQLFEALKRCEKTMTADARSICIPSGHLTIPVRLKDIVYAEVFDKISILHTTDKSLKTYLPLSQLEKELGGPPFLRCHRCSIINMNHVADYTCDYFLMSNGHQVAIRRNGSVAIRQTYLDYIFNQMRGQQHDKH